MLVKGESGHPEDDHPENIAVPVSVIGEKEKRRVGNKREEANLRFAGIEMSETRYYR